MSSESVSNLSDTDGNKKIKRELRLRDRVLVGVLLLGKSFFSPSIFLFDF